MRIYRKKCDEDVDEDIIEYETPHFNTLLYNRCLQIINDLHYYSRFTASNLDEYSCPKEHKEYFCVFELQKHNIDMEAFMKNGGVLGIIKMMKAFISG